MNYLPPNYSNATYFYPDNSGSVGSFTKSVPAQSLVTFDYTSILATGVTITKVSFLLDVQTNPQLIISNKQIGSGSKVVSWIVSGGMGNISYQLSIVATLSNLSVRTDMVQVDVIGGDDVSCCAPSGHSGIVTSIPAGYQQAKLSQNGVYATGLIRYFVSDVAPMGANIMDQWFDTNSNSLLEYISDGNRSFWFNPTSPVTPAAPSNSLFYIAADGQASFTTTIPDEFGKTYLLVITSTVEVHVNGVLYMPQAGAIGDYTVNVGTSTIILLNALAADDVVTIRIS